MYLYALSTTLWARYLEKNGVAPRGFHFSSYWVAETQLERAGALLPFPSYSYWQEDWHPLDDHARAVISEICGAGGCAGSYAANTRAFVNHIGSAQDSEGVRAALSDFGLTPARGTYYGFGINSEGAEPWTGWEGEVVATAWEETARALQDPEDSPAAAHLWSPISVEEVCGMDGLECE